MPRNASGLPVLVWIHGGGYGQGRGSEDMSAIINANGNGFVAVTIQYRVSFSMARGVVENLIMISRLTVWKVGCFRFSVFG